MTVYGYQRVSTVGQDVAPQFDALRRAGIDAENIITDHVSGSRADRPGLNRLLDEHLTAGDVLTVWKLDRLGRSVSHLVHLIDDLGRRGVQFRSLTETLDTTSTSGRLLFHVVSAVAEFERSMAQERTLAALALAKAEGRTLGRPSKVNQHQYALIHQMNRAGVKHGQIAATTGLTRAVVGRVIRGEIASLTERFGLTEDDALTFYEEAQ